MFVGIYGIPKRMNNKQNSKKKKKNIKRVFLKVPETQKSLLGRNFDKYLFIRLERFSLVEFLFSLSIKINPF